MSENPPSYEVATGAKAPQPQKPAPQQQPQNFQPQQQYPPQMMPPQGQQYPPHMMPPQGQPYPQMQMMPPQQGHPSQVIMVPGPYYGQLTPGLGTGGSGGACPVCGGVLVEEFSIVGIILAIFFFPIGLICCLTMRSNRCPRCGYVREC